MDICFIDDFKKTLFLNSFSLLLSTVIIVILGYIFVNKVLIIKLVANSITISINYIFRYKMIGK